MFTEETRGEEEEEGEMIRIREFDSGTDTEAVDEMERSCDVGPASGEREESRRRKKERAMALYVDQLGDPLCRVRHAPDHVMLVAEVVKTGEIAGVIRACVKAVTRGGATGVAAGQPPQYVRVAYILGLRVSPAHMWEGSLVDFFCPCL